MAFGTYVDVNPGTQRIMQLVIAAGPFAFLMFMRMIAGRSKELMLAVWLSIGWLAIRLSLNPQLEFLRDYLRPIERFLQG
jgi:hypothetical protein